jgi:glycolate oxidase subunit GlcD
MKTTQEIKKNLSSLIGDEKVISKDDGRMDIASFQSFGLDRTKTFQPNYDILTFPESTEDVAKIVHYANQEGIAIVPSGGRTGYAGGAVAKNGEIVLSLSKMNQVIDFDPFLGSITVQAGMVTQTVQKEAEDRGYYYPVDFASTGSSHIGGNIATNAGGVRVVRYGLVRDWVLGLTIVTGSGEIHKYNGEILKNNTGYELKHLFIGSEGTLGIITECTLKLTTPPKDIRVILVAVPDFPSILEIFKKTHSAPLPLLAFEFFTEFCLSKVKEHLGVPSPFSEPSDYYVLMEYEIKEDTDEDKLFSILEDITNAELILDGSIAQNSRQNETFWKYREGISESLSLHDTVHKNDISLPLHNMEAFIQEMELLLSGKYPGFQIALFGHVGDGNLHLNILKPQEMDDKEFFTKCKSVDPDMFQLIQKYHGSISAEHGIGLLKKDFLKFSRSEDEIRSMQKIKSIFDPNGILNPGKIL